MGRSHDAGALAGRIKANPPFQGFVQYIPTHTPTQASQRQNTYGKKDSIEKRVTLNTLNLSLIAKRFTTLQQKPGNDLTTNTRATQSPRPTNENSLKITNDKKKRD